MWHRSQNKYGNRRTVYAGVVYHSAREAQYAHDLDLRVRAGELKSWRRQVPVRLIVNGILICKYVVDFVEVDNEGVECWVEVKGFETPEWRLKYALFEALYPDLKKLVVH